MFTGKQYIWLILLLFMTSCYPKQYEEVTDINEISSTPTYDYFPPLTADDLISIIEASEYIEAKHIGFIGEKSKIYSCYEKLLEIASDSLWIELSYSKSPVMRCYAYQALLLKENINLPSIRNRLIKDTSSVCTYSGCMIDCISTLGELILVREEAEKNNKDTSIILKNGIYQLKLQTMVLNDILSENWVEYGFLSPLILEQFLIFYKNGEIIKEYSIPIEKMLKKTNHYSEIALATIPIFNICLLKGKNIDVYEIYGANYCCGVRCPEFLGYYSMEGEILSENIAAKKYLAGKELSNFLAKYKIDINKPEKCNSIFDIFTVEE